jgi:hypothetical protein
VGDGGVEGGLGLGGMGAAVRGLTLTTRPAKLENAG